MNATSLPLPAIEAAPHMVRRLVLKDWYFQRYTILAYLLVGAIALTLLCLPSEGAFHAGSILLLTVVIALGFHLVMASVVGERLESTLPFVMSLPVSPRQYTTAKILANLLIFLLPWAVLCAGAVLVILLRPAVPDGLLPYTVLLMVFLLLGYLIVLSTAIISESQGWTIGVMVACNLLLQAYMYTVSQLPGIAETLKGPDIAWSGTASALLAGMLLLGAGVLSLSLWAQSRKRQFV